MRFKFEKCRAPYYSWWSIFDLDGVWGRWLGDAKTWRGAVQHMRKVWKK